MEELKIIPRCKQGEYGIITVAGQWQPCCNFYTLNIDNKPLEENVDIFNGSSFSIEKTKGRLNCFIELSNNNVI